MSNLLINMWNKINIYCLNHEVPLKMEIMNNEEKIKSPFYNCQDYNNGCPNRLNIDDYQGLVVKFLSFVEEEPASDFENFAFTYKGNRHSVFVKCIKFSDNEINLGIFNKTVFGRPYKEAKA